MEMSTGQRWRSCMAADGKNYHFVPADIEAGSLVAYVVHADDVDARYPLMRQLIKPFRNDAGETILVPAKIYGGEGQENSLTRDALDHSVNKFVAQHNAGQSGEFHMDSRLYADGQAQIARLNGVWSPENIAEALHKYQSGAIEEWVVELKSNEDLVAKGERGPHGEDPAANVKKLSRNIERVFDAQNTEIGLPRIFFREMAESSIGSIPDPKEIASIASSNAELKARQNAFTALVGSDSEKWKLNAINLDPVARYQTAFAAVVTISAEKAKVATDAWRNEAAHVMDAIKTETNSGKDRVANLERLKSSIETRPNLAEKTMLRDFVDLSEKGVCWSPKMKQVVRESPFP